MNKILSILFYGAIILIQITLVSCAEKPLRPEIQSAPEKHRWNAEQISILKQLWIGNLLSREDRSNHASLNKEAVSLGKKIFFDKRFSLNNNISCASCHQPDKYFTDGLKTAKGINKTARNTPTIVGVSQNDWFFHDGRSDSLWSQALGPLESADEHGGNRSIYAHLVFNEPELRLRYEKVFGKIADISDSTRFPFSAGPVTDTHTNKNWQLMSLADQNIINRIFVNIGKSLAAYEATLQVDKSRFDHYIEAIVANNWASAEKTFNNNEAHGLRLFIGKAKCILCHSGPMFTDKVFHNIGTVKMSNEIYDFGRYEGAKKVMKNEFNCRSQYNDNKLDKCNELKYISFDKHETVAAFKTPGLRNVSKTAPYMHDGQYNTLNQVIHHYTDLEKPVIGSRDLLLPITLENREIIQIESFLKTLNSQVKNITQQVKWLID